MKRRTFLASVGVLGIGGATAGLVKNEGDVDETIEDSKRLAGGAVTVTLDDGTTIFGLTSGGFEKVSWADNGDLLVNFEDNPDMHEFAVVGPEPEKNVIATGTPDPYGGQVRVNMNYPLEQGEYTIFGAKMDISGQAWEVDRTGTVKFPVNSQLEVVEVTQADDETNADITLRNTGTAPIQALGVAFEGIPNVFAEDYMGFKNGEKPLLLPDEETVVTSSRDPFLKENGVSVPNQYNVSVISGDRESTWNATVSTESAE
jgi:hypothetical protein